MNKLKVLHLENDDEDAKLVRDSLEREGLDCTLNRVSSTTEFREALQSQPYDLILAKFSSSEFDDASPLLIAKSLCPNVPFLFLSGTAGEEHAIRSLKKGAADYILKARVDRLGAAILQAHEESIVERKRLQDAAQLRQQAELLNQAQDAIMVRSLDREITYWNKGAERLYGWSTKEAIGKRTSDLLSQDGEPDHDLIWKEILNTGFWTGEVTQITKAGKEIDVSSRRTLLSDAAGVALAVLNINTDITEKKDLQSQLFRNQRVDSIGAMAGGIAHDLNNILAPILMVTEMLRDQLQGEDLRILDVAKNSAERGIGLVSQILEFAKGAKAQPVTVDIKVLVADLIRFGRTVFPRSITIESNLEEGLASVLGIPTQLHQVLLNLCINARDAMPVGGVLSIRGRNVALSGRPIHGHKTPISGSFLEISISDTGTGIPPELMHRIFDPFFTTKNENGTGLGLSTVAAILRNHKSFIEVSSEPGKGTTFRIYFPAVPAKLATPESESSSVGAPGRGELILLVDDEFALLEITKALLEAHDYRVLAASNGTEALKVFEERAAEISIVITDLLMPGLGGRELVAAIRDLSPKTITICLTGSTEESAARAYREGSCEFLKKPCSTKVLLNTLDRLLKTSRLKARGLFEQPATAL
jgi:two-component system cell cycle sensor histidine kinase/response regulator CckA